MFLVFVFKTVPFCSLGVSQTGEAIWELLLVKALSIKLQAREMTRWVKQALATQVWRPEFEFWNTQKSRCGSTISTCKAPWGGGRRERENPWRPVDQLARGLQVLMDQLAWGLQSNAGPLLQNSGRWACALSSAHSPRCVHSHTHTDLHKIFSKITLDADRNFCRIYFVFLFSS